MLQLEAKYLKKVQYLSFENLAIQANPISHLEHPRATQFLLDVSQAQSSIRFALRQHPESDSRSIHFLFLTSQADWHAKLLIHAGN